MVREQLIEELIRLWDDPGNTDSELVSCWQKLFASMGIQVRMRVYKKGGRKLVDFEDSNPAGALDMACNCFEEASFYLNNARLKHLLKELLLDICNKYSVK
ncbi:MAG: hypothetical protein AAB389_03955 [Patescibacteria group bacterium]